MELLKSELVPNFLIEEIAGDVLKKTKMRFRRDPKLHKKVHFSSKAKIRLQITINGGEISYKNMVVVSNNSEESQNLAKAILKNYEEIFPKRKSVHLTDLSLDDLELRVYIDLLETSYIFLKDERNREMLSLAIFKGIVSYWNKENFLNYKFKQHLDPEVLQTIFEHLASIPRFFPEKF